MSTTDVVITHNESIEQAISAALELIPLAPLVNGRRVAVKPNETWASEQDTSGITQPDTLRTVLRTVRRHGPRELIVTGGAGAAETDEVFRIAGLMDVVHAEGAEFVDHNRPPFASVNLAYRPSAEVEGPQSSVMVNTRVLEYETLIAVKSTQKHANHFFGQTFSHRSGNYRWTSRDDRHRSAWWLHLRDRPRDREHGRTCRGHRGRPAPRIYESGGSAPLGGGKARHRRERH
jgi:hypothetical protein